MTLIRSLKWAVWGHKARDGEAGRGHDVNTFCLWRTDEIMPSRPFVLFLVLLEANFCHWLQYVVRFDRRQEVTLVRASSSLSKSLQTNCTLKLKSPSKFHYYSKLLIRIVPHLALPHFNKKLNIDKISRELSEDLRKKRSKGSKFVSLRRYLSVDLYVYL